MAMAIAGKVVGRVLSSADQESLVDHFINELGEQA
jgi:F0F1-type ATP synthase membrane subunit b/b'